MKVTMIPIVIGVLGTVTKGLIRGLEDLEISEGMDTIQTTAWLRSARILWRVQEIRAHSDSSWKPSAIAGVKLFQKSKIDIIRWNKASNKIILLLIYHHIKIISLTYLRICMYILNLRYPFQLYILHQLGNTSHWTFHQKAMTVRRL